MKYVYYVDFIPHSAFTPVVLSCKRVYAVCMRVRHSKKMENVSACFFSLVYVSSSFLLYSLLCVWYVFEYTLLFCVTIDVFSRFCRCKQTHKHSKWTGVCVCVRHIERTLARFHWYSTQHTALATHSRNVSILTNSSTQLPFHHHHLSYVSVCDFDHRWLLRRADATGSPFWSLHKWSEKWKMILWIVINHCECSISRQKEASLLLMSFCRIYMSFEQEPRCIECINNNRKVKRNGKRKI